MRMLAWLRPADPADIAAGTDLQRTILRARAARGADCVNRWHEHTTRLLVSVDMVEEDVALLCWTCGKPAHLDLLMKVYCHDQAPSEGVPSCTDMDPNWVNPCQTRRQS